MAFTQKNLGRIYEDKENYEEAFIWYKKAAEHNNSPESYYAQSRLAYLLKNGLGVTKNYPAGMAWTKRAAKNGNSSGQISQRYIGTKRLLSTKTLENSRSL